MTITITFGVAGMTQESNSFARLASTLSDFRIERQMEIVSANRGANTEVGGFLEELDCLQVEAVPLLSGWAISAGPIEDSAFDTLVDLLLEKVKRVKFDGLLLALHGSWLSASHASADAELVRRVRKAIGPEIPIVITLDLHANVTPALLSEVQGVVGFRTYPHVDMAETGRKAVRLLYELVTKGIRPHLYWFPIPLLAPPQSAATDLPAISDLLQRLDSELPADAILSSSFFCVQPWLDVETVNSSLVVVARAESAEAPATLQSIGAELWNRRDEFHVDWVAPEDLVSRVLAERSRPVLVSEAFDGTGAGSPGDHPGVLSVLLPYRRQLSACLFIVDPEVARRAHELGIGAQFSGNLGAGLDSRFASPLRIEARVRHLSDGKFLLKGPVFQGRIVDMGTTAVLEAGGLKVVVASRSTLVIDPELYRSQQVEPADQDIIAVKSPTLFRPGYAAIMKRVIHLDMPGVSQGNLLKVPFARIGRPCWPLDEFSWAASSHPVRCFHT
jgi:microcystin degradation protein MlrC